MVCRVERHSLTVKNCGTAEFCHCLSNRWKSFLEIVLVARVEFDRSLRVRLGNRPEAVALPLERLILAVKWISNQTGNHGRDHSAAKDFRNSNGFSNLERLPRIKSRTSDSDIAAEAVDSVDSDWDRLNGTAGPERAFPGLF